MSTEPLAALDQIDAALSGPQEYPSELSYETPNILLSATSENGIATHSIRESKVVQVPMMTRLSWSETPVDESGQVFAIRARNNIRFGGVRFAVINDACEFGDIKLPATSPSVLEYLSLVGKEVMHHFECSRDLMESERLGKPVYKIVRNVIVLP